MWYFNAELGPYTGDRVSLNDAEIPDRPSDKHTWENDEWILEHWYDWQGLKNALRGTPFFAMATSTVNANAFALLLSSFDSASPNEAKIQDLAFAVGAVRAGLPADYSEEQLASLRSLLQEYGFPVFL